MAFMDAGKPQYSHVSDSKNLSVQTELQIVKIMRFGIRMLQSGIKIFVGFIGLIISEMLHPGTFGKK